MSLASGLVAPRSVGKVSVDGAHCDRPFPNGAGDTFDRTESDVASGEHPGDTRFERQRRPWRRPCRLWDIAAAKDGPTLIERHQTAVGVASSCLIR
jgi:hypothetical protein